VSKLTKKNSKTLCPQILDALRRARYACMQLMRSNCVQSPWQFTPPHPFSTKSHTEKQSTSFWELNSTYCLLHHSQLQYQIPTGKMVNVPSIWSRETSQTRSCSAVHVTKLRDVHGHPTDSHKTFWINGTGWWNKNQRQWQFNTCDSLKL
jgi:hypothetical protein